MEHIFWLEHHPRSINGIIEFLAEKDPVYCICYDDGMFAGRASMGWTSESINGVEFIYLNRLKNVNDFLANFCLSHHDAINYIMGVRASKISECVKQFVLTQNDVKTYMLAERPYLYGKNFVSRTLLNLMYCYLGFKYRDKLDGVFAMGTLGVKAYKHWAHGKVYPFLYPKFNVISTSENEASNPATPLKVLYVGQLDRRKGIDILLNVFQSLPESIHLDVVGDNGDIKCEMQNLMSKMPNVSYQGVWNSAEVARRTADYDLCVVPSRYDGWGMYVMEAIEAGVGVITTDQTGSKDLVYASGAGVVVEAGSLTSLKNAFQSVIDNPKITLEWKRNANIYKKQIERDCVGNYFLQIVSSSDSVPSVKCPWL